jgi:aryl-alcohol dehydrogenase-like predicted oxidoreductase
MISGWATPEGTALFQRSLALPPWAVRSIHGLSLSAIGVGTYGGEEDEATDAMQLNSLVSLLALGCNVIDCAPNYRNGRAETVVGKALAQALRAGIIHRNAVFVGAKVGLAPESFSAPPSFSLGRDGSCYDPEYLRLSLESSLNRLRLAAVDCVFVHNLELLRLRDPVLFPTRFADVAAAMELMITDGLARSWGISSWDGFRVEVNHPAYLSLEDLLAYPVPNLRFLQLPVGLWGSEAITGRWQRGKSILASAQGLGVFSNSPLLQGELVRALAGKVDLIEQAICFSRDAPGVDVTLLGVKKPEHVLAWKRMQFFAPRDVTPTIEEALNCKTVQKP